MDTKVGDIVQMSKRHPCGENRWEILKIGADVKMRCQKCKRIVWLDRAAFNDSVRSAQHVYDNAVARNKPKDVDCYSTYLHKEYDEILENFEHYVLIHFPDAIALFNSNISPNDTRISDVINNTLEQFRQTILDSGDVSTVLWLASLLSWQISRTAYLFDRTLASELVEQKFGEIPMDIFRRMPQYCVCLLDPPDPHAVALYVTVLDKPNVLSLVWQYDDGELLTDIVALKPNAAIEECCNPRTPRAENFFAHFGTAKCVGELLHDAYENKIRRVKRALNLILYLCVDGADIEADDNRKSVGLNRVLRNKYIVGKHVGAAIREARDGNVIESNAHNSPAPHIRSGHYAIYWTGEGRRIPVVKWLAPIFVGRDRLKGELSATIRYVKK